MLVSPLGHEQLRIAELTASTGALEQHYTVQELGEMWRLSPGIITRMFRNEPGILKIGRDHPLRGRRHRITLRIPEPVVQRVYRRLAVR